MRLSFGCDTAASPLKEALLKHAESLGHTCHDCGIFSGEANDYPIFAVRVAKEVLSGASDRGIVICGTGVGVSIAANKINGIRCALCGDCYTAKMTRAHNDANMLAMGARVIGEELAKMILEIFLSTGYDGERHQRRVDMFSLIENREPIE